MSKRHLIIQLKHNAIYMTTEYNKKLMPQFQGIIHNYLFVESELQIYKDSFVIL